ncbi:CRISPR-associated helicase Cas3' [Phytoactinopolyspora mesophila]|uniref:CRISPR-associated helicase Cas3 n=1 Tax=Phytoactinopolyspora mesophila TaxID=2650750 RepID=A0A7K3LZZ4_9ACTN|nr:CRISPR-associated helicase Cas3' [Phytoactinopolyspora mesophila]NDL56611.1 CRISPR-associated helicase Cas3' [Phytoactinopolyspora mesophila]
MGIQLDVAARSVWAKSRNGAGEWLPLWQHMDDSADVASRLFDDWLAPSAATLIARDFGADRDSARCAVRFLAGVHDIGKATPAFAVQDQWLGHRMSRHGLITPSTKAELDERTRAHHTVTGHHVLKRWLTARGWSGRSASAWAVVVGGHHGVPPDDTGLTCTPAGYPLLYGEGLWHDVRNELLERQAERSGAAELLDVWASVRLSQQTQVLLTGLVIMADWIASNEKLFSFRAGELPDVVDETARAQRALATLKLPTPWRPKTWGEDTSALFMERFAFPGGASPRPVQNAAVEVVRTTSEPGILVIEAPMGEGKTEAALAAAELLAERYGAGGLLMALPTQATSDAMFARVVDWLDTMGSTDQKIGASVMLTHGKKRFNRLFHGLMQAGWLHEIGRDEERKKTEHAVVAHSWMAGRKTAQLANFTIGTIDQLLFAGLRSRHLMLRHLGLAGKVVVIDEVHAYNPFMSSYLMRVLTWLGAYGVPVVALSATLPGERRRELVEAYQRGRARLTGDDTAQSAVEVDGDIGYPVLTWTDGSTVGTRVTEPSGRGTTVYLEALDVDEAGDDTESLVSTLREALSDGGNVLVVRNTVRRVLATAQRLEEVFPGEVTVTHARFITADRVRKDEELLDMFGSPRRAKERPRRHVVVASQVVEQSLDVDFDLLVTDLAPVDLVLQRLGRVHRHQRGEGQRERPAKVRRARAYIGGTDFTQSPPVLEPLAARYVYSAHVLYRAAAALRPHLGGELDLPDDIAPVVQQAYGPGDLGPPEWQAAMAAAATAWRERVDRWQAEADTFQILDPGQPGQAITGWVAASAGEADDDDATGQGQVRDGAPSLEAMVIQFGADGRVRTPPWLTEGRGGLEIPRDSAPNDDLGEVMISCAIRLPLDFSNADDEEAIWMATPPAWEQSPLVYRLPALFVDEEGWGEVNGRRVRYTAQRGLEVFRD